MLCIIKYIIHSTYILHSCYIYMFVYMYSRRGLHGGGWSVVFFVLLLFYEVVTWQVQTEYTAHAQ